MIYCADTNVFIDAWARSYPIEIFPRLWKGIESLILEGRLISPYEVKRELERKSDPLLEWAKQQEPLFQPDDEAVQKALLEVMSMAPRLVDAKKNRSGADPWVIALAKVRSATVLTQEQFSSNPEKPRIPDVCQALRVPCVNLLGLIRRERWTF